jgi:hypothetical protein
VTSTFSSPNCSSTCPGDDAPRLRDSLFGPSVHRPISQGPRRWRETLQAFAKTETSDFCSFCLSALSTTLRISDCQEFASEATKAFNNVRVSFWIRSIRSPRAAMRAIVSPVDSASSSNVAALLPSDATALSHSAAPPASARDDRCGDSLAACRSSIRSSLISAKSIFSSNLRLWARSLNSSNS